MDMELRREIAEFAEGIITDSYAKVRLFQILEDTADTIMADGLYSVWCKDCAKCQPQQIRGKCEELINGNAEIEKVNGKILCYAYLPKEVEQVG